jgi:hypothetical protein
MNQSSLTNNNIISAADYVCSSTGYSSTRVPNSRELRIDTTRVRVARYSMHYNYGTVLYSSTPYSEYFTTRAFAGVQSNVQYRTKVQLCILRRVLLEYY